MGKEQRYDAFISYRHADLDTYVAENLHKLMESYKLPRTVSKHGDVTRTKIERVFRDTDELPITNNLEDPIIKALKASEYLIVICSPRIKESVWCKKEIETFIKFHGREKILAVLIEGEPQDAFPDELCYVQETVSNPDGSRETRVKEIEPLAADIRGTDRKAITQKLKSELIRILAPIFGVSYDELKQRHRERRIRKIITSTAIGAAFSVAIGMAGTIAAIRIREQNKKIEAQSYELQIQSEEIQKQYEQLLVNQAINLADDAMECLEDGQVENAIKLAVEANSQYDGMPMPYTPEAKYALTESLRVYDDGSVLKPVYQYETAGIIEDFVVSPNGIYLIATDDVGILYVWDTTTNELIYKLDDLNKDYFLMNNMLCFIGESKLAYINRDNKVYMLDITTGDKNNLDFELQPVCISADNNYKYLAVNCLDNLVIYDSDTMEVLHILEPAEGRYIYDICYFDSDNIIAYMEYDDDTWETGETHIWLNAVDLSTGEKKFETVLDCIEVNSIHFFEGMMCVATNTYGDMEEIYSVVMGINNSTGSKVWELTLDNNVISFTKLFELYGKDELVVKTYKQICFIDPLTGELRHKEPLETDINYINALDEYYVIFSNTGNLGYINYESDMSYFSEAEIECATDEVMLFGVCNSGYLTVPFIDNKITLYKHHVNEDRKVYEGELSYDENGVAEYMDDVFYDTDEAKTLGVENPEMVSNMFYFEDNTKIVVSYMNSVAKIYDVETMQVLETIDIGSDIIYECYGKDSYGNTYINGMSCGYSLDENYRLIARIPSLLKLNRENNTLIIGELFEDAYEYPIYTTEELLEKAEKKIN